VPLRCLIVDDNASFRNAAGKLLERQGVTVVGLASNAAEALRVARQLRPDVVLGCESGLDVARELVGRGGEGPAVILISTHAEADFADLILQTPAAGFVAKSELSAEAIERLIRSPSRGT
jgi:DNA-binding NarL/FixJ family response regulator